MELETEKTEIVSANNIQVEVPNAVEIEEGKKDYEVSVVKKEYTIIGDRIFIPSMYEDAPPWLKELIDTTINVAVANRDQSLIDKLRAILSALDYVPKNQYTEQINQIIGEDGIINSRIATLNSNFVDAINTTNATIAEINLTYASKDEAAAIASNVLTASLSGSGEIGSALMQLQRAYASLEESTAEYLTILDAAFGELVSGTTEQINTIRAYADGIESKFAYNSNLVVNGVTYKSGFGIASSLNDVEGIPIGESEFWINADKFRLTSASSNTKSAYTPFAVDASTGDITFKGRVLIDSIPKEINKYLGGFVSIAELNAYLAGNPEAGNPKIVVNDGDSYLNTAENVIYFWDGDEWISAEAKIEFWSIVFIRTSTKPPTPIDGNYSDPIPSGGWQDGIPGFDPNKDAQDPLWATMALFDNKTDYTLTPPTWTEPVIWADTETTDICYNSRITRPPDPTYTGDLTTVSSTDSANGWYNNPVVGSVWASWRIKKQGKWSQWYTYKVKGEDGTDGQRGDTGSRGSAILHGSGPGTFSSSAASNAFNSKFGYLVNGDQYIWTSTNYGTVIRTYNGSSWVDNTALTVHGDAVINGTLYTSKLIADYLNTDILQVGSSAISSAIRTNAFIMQNRRGTSTSINYLDDENVLIVGDSDSIFGNGIYPEEVRTYSRLDTRGGIYSVNNSHIDLVSPKGRIDITYPGAAGTFTGSASGVAALIGKSTGGGATIKGMSNNTNTFIVSAAGNVWSATASYSFTGAHFVLQQQNVESTVGDILETDSVYPVNVNTAIPKVKITSTEKSTRVYGIFNGHVNSEFSMEHFGIEDYSDYERLKTYLSDNVYDVRGANAIGEGGINVCAANGDIENGDYICSSNIPGKGMKQDDDLLHNYTVAKAIESVVWENEIVGINGCFEQDGVKCKMIACTYHCG